MKNIPQHIAVIMDGNGRWAEAKGLPRIAGHKEGVESLKIVLKACREIGVKYLTVYAFSTENWQRPEIEVATLMVLLKKFIDSEQNEMIENNIRLNAIGQLEKLPEDVRISLKRTMDLTGKNKGMLLNLALSYGGRAEITDAVEALLEKYPRVKKITEKMLGEFLYNPAVPSPDLIIRTSGEQRLSGFLLWQSAYSELYFTPKLWPDFSENDLDAALEEYANRKRRYGK